MKKALLLLSIFLTFYSYSQTSSETIDYINSIVQSYLYYPRFEVTFQDDNIRIVDGKVHDKDEVTSASLVDYKEIKNVLYRKVTNDESKTFYSIQITGQGKHIDLYSGTKTINQTVILLTNDLPEPKMKKLITAIKHLATLKGAKLIKEDLF